MCPQTGMKKNQLFLLHSSCIINLLHSCMHHFWVNYPFKYDRLGDIISKQHPEPYSALNISWTNLICKVDHNERRVGHPGLFEMPAFWMLAVQLLHPVLIRSFRHLSDAVKKNTLFGLPVDEIAWSHFWSCSDSYSKTSKRQRSLNLNETLCSETCLDNMPLKFSLSYS